MVLFKGEEIFSTISDSCSVYQYDKKFNELISSLENSISNVKYIINILDIKVIKLDENQIKITLIYSKKLIVKNKEEQKTISIIK